MGVCDEDERVTVMVGRSVGDGIVFVSFIERDAGDG